MTEHVEGSMPEFSDGDAAGVAYRVLGTTMPVLEAQLQPDQSVISQGGEMSWMTASVQMATATSGAGGSGVMGVLKRAVAGGTIRGSEGTGGFSRQVNRSSRRSRDVVRQTRPVLCAWGRTGPSGGLRAQPRRFWG
jgi:hypothetical protein